MSGVSIVGCTLPLFDFPWSGGAVEGLFTIKLKWVELFYGNPTPPPFFVFGGVANENAKMPMFNDIGPMRFEDVYFGLFWSIPDVCQKNGVEVKFALSFKGIR